MHIGEKLLKTAARCPIVLFNGSEICPGDNELAINNEHWLVAGLERKLQDPIIKIGHDKSATRTEVLCRAVLGPQSSLYHPFFQSAGGR